MTAAAAAAAVVVVAVVVAVVVVTIVVAALGWQRLNIKLPPQKLVNKYTKNSSVLFS